MLERFKGEDGKRRLVEVFSDQELVQNNDDIASRLTDVAILEEFQNGKQLYVKGEPGNNFLFFILSGSFELLTQDKRIIVLDAGQAVGEFPIVDPSLTYTVTVVAREKSIIARVSEKDFLSIARDYPEIWRNMSEMLVTRLRNSSELPETVQHTDQNILNAEDITIGLLIRSLTVVQLWGIIVAIAGSLAATATVAYKMGSGVF